MGTPSFEELYARKADILHLQNRTELRWLWDLFRAACERTPGPKHYLEIGARRGGSFWMLTQAMPVGSLAIAIDLPGARWGDDESDRYLLDNIGELEGAGYAAYAMLVDSHHVSTAQALEAMVVVPSFDLILVDGDHTREGVELDFEMYRRYVAPGGMMAFHDIKVREFGTFEAWQRTMIPWAQDRRWRIDIAPWGGDPNLGIGLLTRPVSGA